jgi:hypothetical protein
MTNADSPFDDNNTQKPTQNPHEFLE